MSVTKTIKIEGMSCQHCSAAVEKALSSLPGVSATVDLDAGTATVVATREVSDAELRKAVEEEDYEVVSIS
ncbi:MAG: cation transporter [Synergistaceae bacterium]|jgi:copper chaperone CopZ|nr:cation transporter [Synergistaceae bacterium]